jgi:4a-hydroxytetrahydrobiopterin dehydratase
MSLADRICRPAARGAPPLDAAQLAPLAAQVPRWTVEQGRCLRRAFRFPDFATALAFVNSIGAEAEAQGHHPDLALGWGRVEVTLTTHDVGGLSEADFILAARFDRLAAAQEAG